ncbi:endoribonuclease Dicer-like [Cloeon dipterum]|uniref:endoribonuclease Dicer-like n=1 Tax=Cloeon dipterum TaxID=197152 RepID=UPI00321FBF42
MIHSPTSGNLESSRTLKARLDDGEGDSVFDYREYQIDMAQKAEEKNSIIYMPTGSGKTYISILVIKAFHAHVKLPFEEGGKRIIFSAPKVALVDQQAEILRKHTPFSVGCYNGYMQVEFWEKNKWLEEFAQHQILVMGSEILRDILDKGFIQMSQFALMIFDECHHATGNHPMNMVMRQHYKPDDPGMPRIMGLTATLIKKNISADKLDCEVATLERNLQCKLVKLPSLDVIKGMYANPNIEMVYCNPASNTQLIAIVKKMIKKLSDSVNLVAEEDSLVSDLRLKLAPGEMVCKSASIVRKVQRQLADILMEIDEIGPYGGSFVIQCHRNRLQCLACVADNQESRKLFMMVVSQLEVIRHLLESAMKRKAENVLDQIKLFSSDKVLKCVEEVRRAVKTNVDTKTIIFVARRITAKVLCAIFKVLSTNDPDLVKIKSDYVVGREDNSYCTKLAQLSMKLNKDSIFSFSTGDTNLLVASNVIEEGIDIPACNLVIKFDEILTYCSFVQSKGRARFQNSKFVILVNARSKFLANKTEYSLLEHRMQMMQLEGEPEPLEAGSSSQFCTPAGAIVTPDNAVSLLYKYCGTLGYDKFGAESLLWFCKNVSAGKKFVSVILPMQTTLIDPIQGPVSPRLIDAKKLCALEAIKKLHEVGQINDNLFSTVTKTSADLVMNKELFPNWNSNDQYDQETGYPGTKAMRRIHSTIPPSVMTDCAPKPDSELYLLSINITPTYEITTDQSNLYTTVYNLLKSKKENFAILSSKPWPCICDFPIFDSHGIFQISIGRVCKTLEVDSSTLEKVRAFHSYLFGKLLNLDRSFLAWNFECGLNNYLIAPVTEDLTLDSKCLEQNFSQSLEPYDIEKFDDLLLKVIVPTYKNKDLVNYVITNLLWNVNPLTSFPSPNYDSYFEYYSQKWGKTVKNLTQPMVEVKRMPSNINYFKPRALTLNKLEKRLLMEESSGENTEKLIPELCHLSGHNRVVTSEMWFKAMLLPSILHRALILLHADELRSKINADCGVGPASVNKWTDLEVSPLFRSHIPEAKNKRSGFGLPKITCHVPKVNEKMCSWQQSQDDTPEPIDPDRHLCEGVSWGQLAEFASFSSQSEALPEQLEIPSHEDQPFLRREVDINVVPIKLLTPDADVEKRGPELSTMYAAITTMSANDVVNMERLETLGDSFLKFITTLYLFCTYDYSEGILTHTKSKLVGNRNLFYCALNRGIAKILNCNAWDPNEDSNIPNLSVPGVLRYLIAKTDLCPSVLNAIVLDEQEKATGQLNDLGKIQEAFELFAEANTESSVYETTLVSFLNKQIAPDKVIADSVEAILGAYIEACGPIAAAKVVSWFQILPESAPSVMTDPVPCNIKNKNVRDAEKEINSHLFEVDKLEEALGYKFRSKSLLLEALTHPSYVANRLTHNCQRLEFLGDAILDFLITAHIYESHSSLTPGEMTDLRSALVNNITFASLTVRYGFHTFLLAHSSTVMHSIDNFVDFQKKNGHKITDDHLLLIQENNINIGIAIEVPKLLGDIFESLIGAVFLDCGKDLVATWNVVYSLMKHEIDLFGMTVPKNAVRRLYESVPKTDLTIGKPSSLDDIEGVQVKIVVNKEGKSLSCIGAGSNKHEAKRAAAKGMLRLLVQAQWYV